MRIVMMDDDESCRSVMALTLRRMGHDVVAAIDEFDALVAIIESDAEGVILDMQGKGGMLTGPRVADALERLRPSTRIVLWSGGAEPRGSRFEFLSKPCDAADLVAALERDDPEQRVKKRA